MPAIGWNDSTSMGYLSWAWPTPTSCEFRFPRLPHKLRYALEPG